MADLKFIVAETNKLIKTDFNMISFDALPIANLVQILVDVLHDFGALSKVIINYGYNCFLVDENKIYISNGTTPFMVGLVNGVAGIYLRLCECNCNAPLV